jgi:hypothetical protein
VGPRAGLDGCGKSRPHRDSIPGRSMPVASRVKRLKIFGFYISKQHYSAVSNRVTKSTCRCHSKCLYFNTLGAGEADLRF